MSYTVDLSGLKQFQKNIDRINKNREKFFKAAAKELAARLLRKVIKRTPVGVNAREAGYDISDETYKKYWAGYNGGTLRRGWTAKSESEAENGGSSDITAFVNSLDVAHAGNMYTITVGNPVHYASFVELGHRQTVGRYVPAIGKCLKRAWVPGQFMLKISEDELQSQTPAILARNIEKWLRKIGE